MRAGLTGGEGRRLRCAGWPHPSPPSIRRLLCSSRVPLRRTGDRYLGCLASRRRRVTVCQSGSAWTCVRSRPRSRTISRWRIGIVLAEMVVVFSVEGVHVMRFFTMLIMSLVVVGGASLVSANPSMLPKHPGYPSGGEFANDKGQSNLTVEQSRSHAALSGDSRTEESMRGLNTARLLESPDLVLVPNGKGLGSGTMPSVSDGPRLPVK